MEADIATHLGARINSWTNPKATRSVQQHSVEQVRFACSVHSRHCDDTKRTLELFQKVLRFLIDFKAYTHCYFKSCRQIFDSYIAFLSCR